MVKEIKSRVSQDVATRLIHFNQPLTGDMLKYAAYKGNYFKDANFDNNMADFFHVLQANNSWDAAAKAFNKYGKH